MMESILIARVDEITSRHDPCRLKGHSCAGGLQNPCCYNTRFRREDPNDPRCLYLGMNGCTSVNLECKTWFCESAIKRMLPGQFNALKDIETTGRECGLVPDPPYLGDPYVGADKPL